MCTFEMPFASRARVELHNHSNRAIRFVFFQIGYYSEPLDGPVRTFHAQFRQTVAKPGEAPVPVMKARGAGRLVGLKMDVQSRGWWLRPPLQDIVIPRGLGLGLLEGWESIEADGRVAQGTGLEDYFNGGFYFRGGPFSTATHGATVRSFIAGRASAYRLHVDDPVHFETSLEVAVDHGFQNQMAGSYATMAYWYQEEPHLEFPPLPPSKSRRPRMAWIHLIQIALCVSVPLVAATALIALIAWP